MDRPSHHNASSTRRTKAKRSAVEYSRRGFIAAVGSITSICILLYGVRFAYLSCDTRDAMAALLSATTSILQDHRIEYWLDKGTLLGFYRDKGLIPWEYDVDIGVMNVTCGAISELRHAFLEYGLIFQDHSDHSVSRYDDESRRFYWSDPYPLEACVRIYDKRDVTTWVDIYAYERFSADRVESIKLENSCALPTGYDYQEDLVCCSDGGRGGHHHVHDPEGTPSCCGKCMPYSVVFPLHKASVPLTAHAINYREEYMPADPGSYLTIQYGPDSLHERRINGWKGYVCGYHVHPWLFTFRCCVLIILAVVAIGYCHTCRRNYQPSVLKHK